MFVGCVLGQDPTSRNRTINAIDVIHFELLFWNKILLRSALFVFCGYLMILIEQLLLMYHYNHVISMHLYNVIETIRVHVKPVINVIYAHNKYTHTTVHQNDF